MCYDGVDVFDYLKVPRTVGVLGCENIDLLAISISELDEHHHVSQAKTLL